MLLTLHHTQTQVECTVNDLCFYLFIYLCFLFLLCKKCEHRCFIYIYINNLRNKFLSQGK